MRADAFIDSFPHPAALVDARGQIVVTNSSWTNAAIDVKTCLLALAIRVKQEQVAIRQSVRDHGRDRVFVVDAVPCEGSVLVTAVDATACVREERTPLIRRLVHELRNVSFALNATITALGEDSMTDDVRQSVEQAEQLSNRLGTLASGLDDFITQPSVPRTRVALDALIDAAVERAGSSIVEMVVPEPVPQVMADGPRLVRAIAQVIENALASSPSGTCPRVEVTANSTSASIIVRDRGPGLRAGQELEVWEPLARRRKGESGLGLSVTRAIVIAHGGSVQARTHERGGSELTLTLPRAN